MARVLLIAVLAFGLGTIAFGETSVSVTLSREMLSSRTAPLFYPPSRRMVPGNTRSKLISPSGIFPPGVHWRDLNTSGSTLTTDAKMMFRERAPRLPPELDNDGYPKPRIRLLNQ